MALTSCLYRGTVFHARLSPRQHQFTVRIFMFYLDLDEIDDLTRKIPLLRSYYQFRDTDHLPGIGKVHDSLKERVIHYLSEQEIYIGQNSKILLLTHLRILGYVFNPVSFYFCFDEAGQCRAALAEVENTFGEKKVYVIPPAYKEESGHSTDWAANSEHSKFFQAIETKFFFVSPFSDLDTRFDFKLHLPEKTLQICIDTLSPQSDSKTQNPSSTILVSKLQGKRTVLTQATLLKATWQYPLMTLKVIGLIHWHALLLLLKRIPFHPKSSNPHWQQNILNPSQSFPNTEKR